MSIKTFPDGTVGEQIVLLDSTGNPVFPSLTPIGAHFSVPDATLAAKYTATKPAGATCLLVQNTGTRTVRFTIDGTGPTNAIGFQLRASVDPILINCPGAAIEFIREDVGAALDGQWVA